MALQFEPLFIPVAGGLDQSVDDRLLMSGSMIDQGGTRVTRGGNLLECRNGLFSKTGAISKRHGYTQMATAMAGGGNIPDARRIFSTGEELCVLGKRRMWSRNSTDGLWYDRGPVSPLTGRQEVISRGPRSYNQIDVAVKGNYQIIAMQSERQVDDDPAIPANRELSMVLTTRTLSDQTIIPPTDYGTGTMAAGSPHSVRAASCTGKLLALCMRGYSPMGGGVPLELYEYPTATPLAAPVLWGNITATAWVPVPTADKNNIRSYDAIPLANGDWLVAYIDDGTRDLVVERRSPAHAVINTVTLALTASRVALAEDASTGEIMIFYVNVPGVEMAYVIKYDAALAAPIWGPFLVYTTAAADSVEAIAVTDLGGARAICAWSIYTTATDTYYRTFSRTATWAVGALGTMPQIDNVQLRSRPFAVEGRAYAFVQTACRDANFETNAIVDLNEERVPNPWMDLVGVFDSNSAPAWQLSQMAMAIGSAANVVQIGSGWRTGSVSTAYHLLEVPGAPHLNQAERFATSLVDVEFFGPVSIERAVPGAVIIGGGVLSWYVSGGYAVELGIITPPVISATTEYNSAMAPGVVNDTYYYMAVWESYDRKGYLTRSSPSAAFVHTHGGNPPNDGVHIDVRQVGLTNRAASYVWGPPYAGVYEMAPQIYRSGAPIGQFQRITEPRRTTPNVRGYEWRRVTDDYGQTGADLLYVMSGEIEAVMPNGCRFVSTVGERFWLTDSWTEDWVQFSKLYTPGTVTETPHVPEFNEGFGYRAQKGETMVGVAALGDTAILFTRSQVYAVAGLGPDDAGNNNDFSRMTTLVAKVGCVDFRSIVSFPLGVMFQSDDGLYMLDRGHGIRRMAEVEDLIHTYPTVTSATVNADTHEVRFTVSGAAGGRILVYNYVHDAWSQLRPLTAAGGEQSFLDACWHDGVYYAVTSTGQVWYEDAASYIDAGTQYVPLVIESAWIQPAKPGGWNRVRHMGFLSKRHDPHNLVVNVYSDYETTAVQTITWTAADITAWPYPSRQQPRVHLLRQKAQAYKIRVEDTVATSSVTGQGYTLEGFNMLASMKRTLATVAPAQRN